MGSDRLKIRCSSSNPRTFFSELHYNLLPFKLLSCSAHLLGTMSAGHVVVPLGQEKNTEASTSIQLNSKGKCGSSLPQCSQTWHTRKPSELRRQGFPREIVLTHISDASLSGWSGMCQCQVFSGKQGNSPSLPQTVWSCPHY